MSDAIAGRALAKAEKKEKGRIYRAWQRLEEHGTDHRVRVARVHFACPSEAKLFEGLLRSHVLNYHWGGGEQLNTWGRNFGHLIARCEILPHLLQDLVRAACMGIVLCRLW